jgi:hypothetical protein
MPRVPIYGVNGCNATIKKRMKSTRYMRENLLIGSDGLSIYHMVLGYSD